MSASNLPDAFEEVLSRYIVGIDLGTTNCAVAFSDTQAAEPHRIETFWVEQWVDFGASQRRELLPSFLYQPLAEETQSLGSSAAAARTRIVGSLARDRGLQLPGRQVASAKSWLCHDGVDRRSPILPWQNDEAVENISPVMASSEILEHIRLAWDRAHPGYPLAEQDIVLTLPASFDQVARQLTIEAAAAAGLKAILPIEEPQAAFYAWLAGHPDNWEQQVAAGQTILVCDIGGGTTDFTLIRVRRSTASETTGTTLAAEQATASVPSAAGQSKLSLHRVAVGQHLILGGDNLDLALAQLAESKLSGGQRLAPRTWDALRQACRAAKEDLLGPSPPATTTLHLPGSGSKLIGGGRQVELSQAEVQQCVLDGFFPQCDLLSRPESQQVGFQEFGLPFARDPAITRHLAHFLWEHRWDGREEAERSGLDDRGAARPDWILFNGGVMSSAQLRQRLLSTLGQWFAGSGGVADDWTPGVLSGQRLDLAVAHGAAYFGGLRRGRGVEIEAKLACSYYLQTSQTPPQAVCIVPGSASPGDKFALADRPMDLAVGQPVEFPLLYSSTRLADPVGASVPIDPEHFASLPPIRTVIETSGSRRQTSLPVYVEVELSQIGTLQVFCHAAQSDQRWKLEFDVRGSTQTDFENRPATAATSGTLDEQAAQTAHAVLAEVFTAAGTLKPSRLMPTLAERLGLKKHQWPPHLLRSIWAGLMEHLAGRRLSAEHEARWLNLLGYALRPGYGMAADDWRVAQSWRAIHGKLFFAAASSRNESLILWRRIAGGFTAGQQLTVYQQVAGPLRGVLDPVRRSKGSGTLSPHELVELLRLVGSLELLSKAEKGQLGDWLLELLEVKKWSAARGACLWTLGRLASRQPAYGPLNCVVDSQHVERWLNELARCRGDEPELALALMLGGRRVHDRYRDISEATRQQVLTRMHSLAAPEHWLSLVRDGGQLHREEADQVWGEALPLGLTLRE